MRRGRTILTIGATGKYSVAATFKGPSTLGNLNNEGIGIAPESECVGGFKSFYWSDDSNDNGHSLRRDTIPCGAFLP